MTRRARLMLTAFSFLFLTLDQAYAQSFEVLDLKVGQGGVVIVRIIPQWQGPMVCISAFGKHYIPNKYGYVLIGIAANTKPEKTAVYLVECGRGVRLDGYFQEVEILERDFGASWYVGPVGKPNKAVQEQRAREIAIMHAAYDLADKSDNYTSGQFVLPLPLDTIEVTDSFGTLRLYGSYNRKTKRIKVEREVPHGGVDLRARTPLPVMAINSGKVLLAHHFPLSGTEGNLLVIDHGSGILSLYLHLSRFDVEQGDKVKKGQIVALTGATPRGTSPHLHFMIKVNGTNVDPLRFIDTMNQHFK